MLSYAFHETTLCGRDLEPPRVILLPDDAAAYGLAKALIAPGNRVVEVWRGDALVWRFETAGQNCDASCHEARFAGNTGFERWMPACRLHPLTRALALANLEATAEAA